MDQDALIDLYLPETDNQRDSMRELVRTILRDSYVLDLAYDKSRKNLAIIFAKRTRSSDNNVANDHQRRFFVDIVAHENAFARLCGCQPFIFITDLKRRVFTKNRAVAVSKIDAWQKELEEIFKLSGLENTRLNFSAIEWCELDKTRTGLILGLLTIEPQRCQLVPIDIAA